MSEVRSEKDRGTLMADLEADQRRGLELGQQIEAAMMGERASAVVLACNLVLAAVIVQAIEEKDVTKNGAISLMATQLDTCVRQLLLHRRATVQ